MLPIPSFEPSLARRKSASSFFSFKLKSSSSENEKVFSKYFFKKDRKIFLEAANPNYDPIELNLDEVIFQGKLLAVWRKI